MPSTSDILAAINLRHATAFALLDRYARGEQGAYALVGAAGDRFVLKWAADCSVLTCYQHAQRITDWPIAFTARLIGRSVITQQTRSSDG